MSPLTKSTPPPAAGFTLIELLVVIGIIAVLVAVVFPALNGSMQSSKKVKCSTNLRQLGAAIFLYAGEHDGFMPVDSAENYAAGKDYPWSKLIAPYIPTRNGANVGVLINKVFRCPSEVQPPDSEPGSALHYTATYAMALGPTLDPPSGTITKGPRKTLAVEHPSTTLLLVDGKLGTGSAQYYCSSSSTYTAVAADLNRASPAVATTSIFGTKNR